MSNQIEYFQHLVDNCEDANTKWVLQDQLDKERRRVAKRKAAAKKAREEAANNTITPDSNPEPTATDDKPRRGRPKKEQE